MDDLLRKHVEQLPVAALALPPVCCRRPWWVILSAHEASHHVQFESPGLEQLAQDQVVGAAYAVTEDVELAEAWRPWCRELFADALSVLLTGPAAIWAVDELETRTAPGMPEEPVRQLPAAPRPAGGAAGGGAAGRRFLGRSGRTRDGRR